MLYTVVPLDRIYHCRTESVLFKASREDTSLTGEADREEYKDISIPHGSIRARKEGEQYFVESIQSTDMSDYLRADYLPGAQIKV